MDMDNWSYTGTNGPDSWTKLYANQVSGRKQSPINIVEEELESIEKNEEFNPLLFDYPNEFNNLRLANAGMGWKIDIPDNLSFKSILSNGSLEHKYQLEQFHCHWGKDSSCGSEHTLNGKHYAAELHFVHYNCLYSSFYQAMKNPNGLAVVAVFLETVDTGFDENMDENGNQINLDSNLELNAEFSEIVKRMEKIPYKGQSVIIESLNIKELFPKDYSYFTYEGSLTTPPLYESVTWIILKTPILVSEKELDSFRNLHTHERYNAPEIGPVKLTENFRPVQPLCERTVNLVEL